MSKVSRGTRADNTGLSLRRLYRQLLEVPAVQGAHTQARPNSDPGFQAALSLQNFDETAQVGFGVITDVTAIANCYRVQLDKMHYPITATLGVQGSTAAFGARPLNTIQPGSQVIVIWHPNLYYGVILAVIPFAQTDGKKSVHEQLCHTTRNRVDEGHKQPLKLGGKGFVTDWLSGRPFDATNVGEGGWITETGMRIFIDPFMAMVGLDEATSVTAFYADQLLRIAGYNLRMFTAGYEREGLDDGCEYNDWSGFTPYPWEQLGMFDRGDPREEHKPQAWQVDEPWHGPWELETDQARPWHRSMHYHGYFGQGGKQTIVTKPAGETQAKFDPEQPVYPCLFDQMVTLDGRIMLASAKGVHILKRSGLVAPQRKYPPEQIKDEGDNAENYKFASKAGDGPDHEISGGLEIQGDAASLVRAAAVQDLHAYLFNYVSFHGMYWHERDWDCPEQGDLDHIGGQFIAVPTFNSLSSSMFLEPPPAQQVPIDHRYENTEIIGNEAGISFLDDGGVVLFDGFGGEIRMTGGSIFLSAPGDVWMKPGRTANIWGGDDVIIKAKNSVDVSATKKDVRVKAEQNMQMLSGNGGLGGTLIESRGNRRYDFEEKVGEDIQSGAVMLRAPKSDVVAWANKIYLRTGGGEIAGGPIILDAAKGQQAIVTHSRMHHHYIDGPFFIHYGREGELRESLIFSENYSAIPSTLFVDGVGIFAKSVMCKGNLIAAGGHVVTTKGCSNPFVGCLKNPGSINQLVSKGQQNTTETFPQSIGKTYYSQQLEEQLYAEKQAGNDDTITLAEFSFRDVAQYGTDSFSLYEDRWQQQGRITGNASNKWEEKKVVTQKEDTYPYPGRDHYEAGGEDSDADGVLLQLDLALADLENNRDKDRGASPELNDEYKDPKTEEPTPVSLNDYLVIR
jgi:hypothetical protein